MSEIDYQMIRDCALCVCRAALSRISQHSNVPKIMVPAGGHYARQLNPQQTRLGNSQ